MAEAALQKALAGRTPGKPESCVSLSELGSQRIIDRNTILFEGHGGRTWRNDLRHGCPGLAPGRAILTKPTLTRHCRGDIFQVIDPPAHMTMGACGFGDFFPYTKPKPCSDGAAPGAAPHSEIGRASCRERVCPYV